MSLREESTSPLAPLVFLHIPKTAGKFVGKCITESLKETNYHNNNCNCN